jgi:hypothetical protein
MRKFKWLRFDPLLSPTLPIEWGWFIRKLFSSQMSSRLSCSQIHRASQLRTYSQIFCPSSSGILYLSNKLSPRMFCLYWSLSLDLKRWSSSISAFRDHPVEIRIKDFRKWSKNTRIEDWGNAEVAWQWKCRFHYLLHEISFNVGSGMGWTSSSCYLVLTRRIVPSLPSQNVPRFNSCRITRSLKVSAYWSDSSSYHLIILSSVSSGWEKKKRLMLFKMEYNSTSYLSRSQIIRTCCSILNYFCTKLVTASLDTVLENEYLKWISWIRAFIWDSMEWFRLAYSQRYGGP